jgi:hypothetical protein
MKIQFTIPENGPKNLLAEADIVFDSGIMAGTRLVGFSLWRSEKGDSIVTLPSRAWGGPGERRFFDLVRAGDGGADAVKALKAAMAEAFRTQEAARS